MFLAVDVGNSSIAFGVFDNLRLIRSGRTATSQGHQLADNIGDDPFTEVILGSVSPSVTEQVIPLLAMRYNTSVRVAGRDIPFGMDIQCDQPETVGADRLLNAMAAHARCGTSAIVVDVGTAITVDYVSDRGSFCGGAIAPGPQMMLDALHNRTELLPHYPVEKPDSALGRDTQQAMLSGAYWGSVGLIEELISRMLSEQGAVSQIFVTGGLGDVIAGDLSHDAVLVPELTLEGLARLATGQQAK